jgi:hypothetical protein
MNYLVPVVVSPNAERRHAKNRQVLAAFLVAGCGLMLLPGCVFVAVRAVKAVSRTVNPPQPLLVATGTFFDGAVTVTARLVAPNPEMRKRWLKQAETREKSGAAETDEEMQGAAGAGTRLVVVLRNRGATEVPLAVVALESARGKLSNVPLAVLLAPGQRNVLPPVAAEGGTNIGRLEVTLVLKKGDAVETQKLELKARDEAEKT